MLERIDLFVEVPVESKGVQRLWQAPEVEVTRVARDQVAAARPAHRPSVNARLEGEALRENAPLEPAAERLLADAAQRWSLSARAVHRTLRVARSVADLSASATIGEAAIAEALSYRHEGRVGGNSS